jgi:hypothetical protein
MSAFWTDSRWDAAHTESVWLWHWPRTLCHRCVDFITWMSAQLDISIGHIPKTVFHMKKCSPPNLSETFFCLVIIYWNVMERMNQLAWYDHKRYTELRAAHVVTGLTSNPVCLQRAAVPAYEEESSSGNCSFILRLMGQSEPSCFYSPYTRRSGILLTYVLHVCWKVEIWSHCTVFLHMSFLSWVLVCCTKI